MPDHPMTMAQDRAHRVERLGLGMMKIVGVERSRFARSLLYGTPTTWNLDRAELARIGTWLKAAQDDFKMAHGWKTLVALTGFRWLSDDHLVQQSVYADGRILIANFGEAAWQGLGPDCVRLVRPAGARTDMCPRPLRHRSNRRPGRPESI